MVSLPQLIVIGGILHFSLLMAGIAVPRVLDWRKSLKGLDPLSREIIWVHGAFIVLVLIAFGVLSVVYSTELAAGSPLARGMCGFIAIFWAVRLVVQFFVFNARPHLTSLLRRVGYHALTIVFTYHAVIYSLAAFLPHRLGS